MQARHLLFAALAVAAAGTFSLQPCFAATAHAATHAGVHRASRAPGQDDRKFMRQAAQAGRFEVAAGQLAAARGQDPGVRRYGERLVHDHAAANRKLQRIAGNFGITLPSLPTGAQEQILARLRGVKGEKFDTEFMEQVGIESHDRAIALFQHEAHAPSADPALQHFARTTLPTLVEHRRMARDMQAGVRRAPAYRVALADAKA